MSGFNNTSIGGNATEGTNKKNVASLNKRAISYKIQGTDKSKIAGLIGQGEDAKNSIVWIIVRWCLGIPLIITIFYFVTMWGVYLNGLDYKEQVPQIREHIIKIWGVFAPIITLALGYIFGKHAGSQ